MHLINKFLTIISEKIILSVLVVFLVGCEGGDSSSEISDINLFSGDVHKIVNADESELIKKYKVFKLSILLKGFGVNFYDRKISFLDGVSVITDDSKYHSISENASETKVVAQKIFDDFSKAHGKAISEKIEMKPATDYRSKVKRVVYKFEKENGYIPSIVLEWSTDYYHGKKRYGINVTEMHLKIGST